MQHSPPIPSRTSLPPPKPSPRSRLPPAHPHRRNNTRLRPLARPSSSWKDALKRGCLDRARKKRQQLVRCMRSDINSPTRSRSSLGGSSIGSSSPIRSSAAGGGQSPASETARQLVEEELRASHVSVSSPGKFLSTASGCEFGTPSPLRERGGMQVDVVEQLDFRDGMTENDECVISEEELIMLMREVEDELQREEELLAEEIHNMEQQQLQEQQCMEEQIADFEMWQEGSISTTWNPTATAVFCDEVVPCPVCGSASLLQPSPGVLSCPNTLCNFRLNGSTLYQLKDVLRKAYEEHSSVCNGLLMLRPKGDCGLLAGCETCRANVILL